MIRTDIIVMIGNMRVKMTSVKILERKTRLKINNCLVEQQVLPQVLKVLPPLVRRKKVIKQPQVIRLPQEIKLLEIKQLQEEIRQEVIKLLEEIRKQLVELVLEVIRQLVEIKRSEMSCRMTNIIS
jgi:acetolactate synthase small subunit